MVSVSRVESAASTMFHLLTTLLTTFPKCTVNSIKMFLLRRPGFSHCSLICLLFLQVTTHWALWMEEPAGRLEW